MPIATVRQLCIPNTLVTSDSLVEQVAQIDDLSSGKIDGRYFFQHNHFTDGLERLVRRGFDRLAGAAEDGAFYLTQAMGGGETLPQTVQECNFIAERLRTLQSRQSAAYKGLHALLMQRGGALDWRTGAEVQEQTYFDESMDIHHIFPRAWCEKRGIGRGFYNSIVNKTALSAPTNRFLGGDAPSIYLKRLQERQKLTPEQIDSFLKSHFINGEQLRSDDLTGMMVARAEALAVEIAAATGREVNGSHFTEIFGGRTTADDVVEDLAA